MSACLACLSFQASVFAQKSNYSQQFEGVKELEFNIFHGTLNLVGSGSGQLEISGSYLGEERPTVTRKADELLFTERSATDGSSPDWSVWTIKIPDNLNVDIRIGGGDVNLEGVSGNIRSNMGAGDFTVSNSHGTIRANTGTGTIRVRDSSGEFQLNTGTGDVSLLQVTGSVNANSGTGDVVMDEATINGTSSLSSGTGQVTLGNQSQLNANISLNSGTDDSIIHLTGSQFQGTLNMRCSLEHGKIEAPFLFDQETTEGRGKNAKLLKTKRFGPTEVTVSVATGTGRAVAD